MQLKQQKEKKPRLGLKKMHLEGNPLNGFFNYLLLKKSANHGTDISNPFSCEEKKTLS